MISTLFKRDSILSSVQPQNTSNYDNSALEFIVQVATNLLNTCIDFYIFLSIRMIKYDIKTCTGEFFHFYYK